VRGQHAPVAGMVLTGGASRRMGVDKIMVNIAGEPCITQIERAIRTVASPCLEIGPGRRSFQSLIEPMPGRGPLAAIAAGGTALRALGHHGPALVVAGDLPLVTVALMRWLATRPGNGSVVPVVEGRGQPLLAWWSHWDLYQAAHTLERGGSSLRGLPGDTGTTIATETMWPSVATAEIFSDIDTPEDLQRLELISEALLDIGTSGSQFGPSR
jgi:molybdopterin-guanine dinucleotide biosynthesis protein A